MSDVMSSLVVQVAEWRQTRTRKDVHRASSDVFRHRYAETVDLPFDTT